MIVAKSHKILLKTTPEHDATFTSWCGAARVTYNWGLECKIAAFRERGTLPGAFALMTEMVALKQTDEYAWLNAVPKSVPRMALLQLEFAYGHFFRRVKKGVEEKGFPKFKSKKRSKLSFHDR